MKLILKLFIFLGLVFVITSFSCLWQGKFLDNSLKKDVIAKVKIIGYDDYVMRYNNDSIALTLVIQIKELYKGKVLDSIVRLTGDNGNSWQMYAEIFEKEKMYYIQYNYKGMFNEQGISACAENALLIHEFSVGEGFLSYVEGTDTKSMKVNEFEQKLLHTLHNCANLSFDVRSNIVQQQVADSCEPRTNVSSVLYSLFLVLLVLGIISYIYFKVNRKTN